LFEFILFSASGGELFDAIVNKGSYSEVDAAKIIKQILEAIQYVHNHGIAHRDLKPENLLLIQNDNNEDKIKIADFGLSKDFGEEQLQTSCGTPDYVGNDLYPKLIASTRSFDGRSIRYGRRYLVHRSHLLRLVSFPTTILIHCRLCGFPPFYGDSQKELFENIMSGTYDFPDPEWTDVSAQGRYFKRYFQKIFSRDIFCSHI
jgi:calcium/calmodulin-dependent protein kinase I